MSGCTRLNNFETTVATPAKCPGLSSPSRISGKARYFNAHTCDRSKRINGFDLGREQQVAAAGMQAGLILRQRARVAGEVLARAKLGRIDENTGDDAIRMRARDGNKGKVPIV